MSEINKRLIEFVEYDWARSQFSTRGMYIPIEKMDPYQQFTVTVERLRQAQRKVSEGDKTAIPRAKEAGKIMRLIRPCLPKDARPYNLSWVISEQDRRLVESTGPKPVVERRSRGIKGRLGF
jgi:hypothetical protein